MATVVAAVPVNLWEAASWTVARPATDTTAGADDVPGAEVVKPRTCPAAAAAATMSCIVIVVVVVPEPATDVRWLRRFVALDRAAAMAAFWNETIKPN